MSQCESCGEPLTEEGVAHAEEYPGHRETVVLWFCAGCSQ